MIDMVESFETRWPDKSAVARSTADVESQFAAGLVSLPMGMENGAPIEEPSDSFRRSSTHPERKSGLRTWDLIDRFHRDGWSLALLGEKCF
jgi:hypothetical protein